MQKFGLIIFKPMQHMPFKQTALVSVLKVYNILYIYHFIMM